MCIIQGVEPVFDSVSGTDCKTRGWCRVWYQFAVLGCGPGWHTRYGTRRFDAGVVPVVEQVISGGWGT